MEQASSHNRTDPLNRVLAGLERVVDRGYGQFYACCPAHDDTNPSLSIKVLDDGRVLIHCFAGCTIDQVLMALHLELPDLYPVGSRPAIGGSVRWNYRDLLLLARREMQVAVLAVDRVLNDQPIDVADRCRLVGAHSRLAKLIDVTND